MDFTGECLCLSAYKGEEDNSGPCMYVVWIYDYVPFILLLKHNHSTHIFYISQGYTLEPHGIGNIVLRLWEIVKKNGKTSDIVFVFIHAKSFTDQAPSLNLITIFEGTLHLHSGL